MADGLTEVGELGPQGRLGRHRRRLQARQQGLEIEPASPTSRATPRRWCSAAIAAPARAVNSCRVSGWSGSLRSSSSWRTRARCSGVGLAVPTSIWRYIWRESTDSTARSRASASSIARAVLPLAVGPSRAITSGRSAPGEGATGVGCGGRKPGATGGSGHPAGGGSMR